MACEGGVLVKSVADEMSACILRNDIDCLMRRISPEGILVVDRELTRDDVCQLLRDEGSWLHQALFVGEKSLKVYLQNARNLNFRVEEGEHDVAVMLDADNYSKNDTRMFCFWCQGDVWYFTMLLSD